MRGVRRRPVAPTTAKTRPPVLSVLVSGAGLLLLWQALVVLARIPAWLLPSPLLVIERFKVALADGTLAA
ncbi:MAG: taurine ABC transporter permease, partial [Chloroflexota bacterium]|nr:taurine ABC transporter permease [Chloroflexota bacterium]